MSAFFSLRQPVFCAASVCAALSLSACETPGPLTHTAPGGSGYYSSGKLPGAYPPGASGRYNHAPQEGYVSRSYGGYDERAHGYNDAPPPYDTAYSGYNNAPYAGGAVTENDIPPPGAPHSHVTQGADKGDIQSCQGQELACVFSRGGVTLGNERSAGGSEMQQAFKAPMTERDGQGNVPSRIFRVYYEKGSERITRIVF